MTNHICMIAYTTYSTDARVRREAETVASLPGCLVSVVVLREGPDPRNYVVDGVEVLELNVPKYRGKSTLRYFASYLTFLMYAFGKCTAMLFKGSLRLVHIHNMPNFLVFAAIVPRLFGVKAILDIHDIVIETYSSKFGGLSNKLSKAGLHLEEWISCKLANKIICTNHIQQQTLVSRGIHEDKVHVIMNLPDPKRFRPRNRTGPSVSDGAFRVIYFGTITKRLGIDLAIRAVGEIRAQVAGLEFFIYGSGEDRDEFVALSSELGVDKVVHFSEGALPLEEIIGIVQTMDLVVVPNRRSVATDQMLPVKLLEGISLGVPVVAPRLKPIEYYFDSDQVFYFDAGDVGSLGKAILTAYEDRRALDGKARNAMRFLERYNWETHKQELLGLYRSLAQLG